MPGLNLDQVEEAARQAGYRMTQLCHREGVVAFTRPDSDGWRQLVRVWWARGTVGTYLKHPSQGKTQLFRRNVHHISDVIAILKNPRVHTGAGYQRRQGASGAALQRTVSCPLCARMYRTVVDAVGHVESGGCSHCPGRDNARQATYQFACQQDKSSSFTIQHPLLEYGDSSGTSGWRSEGPNYHCGACSRAFTALSSLMQHQSARPQCRTQGGPAAMPQISV